MKFSCLQENFALGIKTVGHLALRSSSLPILANVHIVADKNGLTLQTTNLEVGAQYTVRGKVEGEGDFLVPARLLLDLLPLLPGGQMQLEHTAKGLYLVIGKAKTTLRTTPSAEFPTIPTLDQQTYQYNFPVLAFQQALGAVSFATGRVEHRPQFSGVLLRTNEQSLIAVATDGYRLAEASLPMNGQAAALQVILPATAVQEIDRLMMNEGEVVEAMIQGNENQIDFTVGAAHVTSRLIDGAYPDYLPLFPEQATTIVSVDRVELSRAIKAATIFSRAGLSDVTLQVSPSAQQLIVKAENAEVGAHEGEVAVSGKGPDVTIVVNARYLLDGLSALPTNTAELGLTTADRPLLLKPGEKSGLGYRYLVMPIRQ